MNENVKESYKNDIAIIGMNLRFPGIATEEEFWEVLKDGKESLSLQEKDTTPKDNFIPVHAALENSELFDREFFGYTKREAEIMDPQHRLFLQCAWEILEKAGYNPSAYDGLIGVFAGVSTSTYLMNNLISHPEIVKSVGDLQLSIFNEKDHFAGKVSYKLDLKGPCVTVQTVCSTSMVAVHLACQSLLNGECDMTLSGGVTIKYPKVNGYDFYQGGMVSSDGHIRAFDQSATGTVYSDGMGILLLKRMEDALEDGDTIRAVIKGSAVSSDGGDRVGYTAPGVNGQLTTIVEAQMVSQVSAETIGMIEAHGSGTPLGDAIELDALLQAFRASTDETSFCALGSVKTNIGHTQYASGAAGIMKAVLALEHKQIPASLNCMNPNEKLGFDETPFYVNTFCTDWIEKDHPRRAGVSSFGLGGVNAHIILEEAPLLEDETYENRKDETEAYCLSARAQSSLMNMIDNHLGYLKEHTGIRLRDAAVTLKTGRMSFPWRIAVPFGSESSLIQALEEVKKDIALSGRKADQKLTYSFGDISVLSLLELLKEARVNEPLRETIEEVCVEAGFYNLAEIMNEPQKNFLSQYLLARYLQKLFPDIKPGMAKGLGILAAQVFNGSLTLKEGLMKAKSGFRAEALTLNEKWSGEGAIRLGYEKGTTPSYSTLEVILSEIWQCGYDINWDHYYQNKPFNHIVLPTYPFELDKYYIEVNDSTAVVTREPVSDQITLDQVQRQMKKVWMEKLGVEEVDETDNFFQLGGHSLLVTQVVFSINAAYKIDFPLQCFYEAPVLKDLSEEVYEFLLSNQHNYDDLPVARENIEERYEPFPLTDVQKAYWLGRNGYMELGNTSTHMYFESDMKDLNMEQFETAFNKMIKRHEMLRAVMLPDGAQKIIEAVPEYHIHYEEIIVQGDEEQIEKIITIREEMSHQVIDCYTWPLFDIRATKLKGNITKLHISIDLLIADAWSLELLLGELSYVYHNQDAVQEELRLSFRDYVQVLNEIEQTNRYEKSKAYWKERVKDLPSAPMLPLRMDPAAVLTPHFVRRRAVVGRNEWVNIKEKADKFNISETVVLLTAFSEVLALWSRERRFTLNLTVFNRLPVHEQVNDIIGDFTALTLLEVVNDIGLTLLGRMKRNQEQLLSDMDHRYYNGVRVTRDLIKEYKDSSRAIMPIIFTSILNQKSNSWDSSKSFTEDLEEDKDTYSISQTPQVWLDHQVIERNGELMYNWDAVEEIFPENMIEEMFQDYRKLLFYLSSSDMIWECINPLCEKTFAFPHQNSLKPEEKQEANEVPEELLQDFFIEMVKKSPLAPALITSTEIISYQELDVISDRIAELIHAQKGCTSQLVAVVMEKGWEQIAAVFGILKAGHAYLPIDGTQPNERILGILESAEVQICIVQKTIVSLEGKLIQIIADEKLVQGYREDPDSFGKKPFAIHTKPDDTAYVIYTSGSTGKPKGVIVSHRGAMNTICDMNLRFHIIEKDRVLALSSLCFDLSVYDIFGILSAGGAIVVPDKDKLRDPEHWSMLMQEHKVTIWNSVPALMKMLTGMERSGDLDGLRLVLLSGDWIDTDIPKTIWKQNESIEIISLGGATEASIWSVIYPIQKGVEYRSSIPYGRAMANQTMYVLNGAMQQCPTGVSGEIYIGGIGLAKGYWKDQEKTDRKFFKNPFTGERLYRTGDFGRYLEDGNIEFLGRQDNQIKINGYRIELGEIECALKENDMVADAAVLVNDRSLGKQLVAFVKVDKENAYGLQGMDEEEIILDSAERMQFKLREYAIRELKGHKRIHLDSSVLQTDEYYRHRSYRHFKQEIMPLACFCNMIGSLAQRKNDSMLFPKYRYASGGGLYPLQAYIYIKVERISGIPGGLYYYDPRMHDMVLMKEGIVLPDEMHEQGNQDIFRESAFSIFIVGNTYVIKSLYGEKDGLNYMKIEAGLISSLLESAGLENQIGLCQIGTLDFNKIHDYLELDEDAMYLHCLLGGMITKDQMTYEGFLKEWSAYQQSNDMKGGEHKGKKNIAKILKKEIKEKLPDYMIPSKIILVNALPLTANGKIDRKALLEMVESSEPVVAARNHNMPETWEQKVVYDIWKECFEGKEFGIHDNFFDLGGDSVMTVQVFGKLKKEFSKPMTIVDLFSYPTVESLAVFLAQGAVSSEAIEDENELLRVDKRKRSLNKRGKRYQGNQ